MLKMFQLNSNRSRQITTMIALSAMMFLQNIDVSAVNLALATIARDFNTKLSTIEWVLNVYAMAAGALMILSGRLGDILGRRTIFIIGTIIFGASSLISGLAPNTICIIVGRFFQGVGMSMVFPQIIALSALAYPKERQSNAVAFMVSIAGLSQAIGPTIGGYITQWFSWRFIFLINVPICIGAIILSFMSITDSRDETHSGGIDYIGAVFMALSFFLITFALNEVQRWGIYSAEFLVCLISGILLLILFILVEKAKKNSLIDIKLFSQKTFIFGALIRNICIYGMTTVMLIMGLFMQNILQYSPSKTGVLFLGMTFLFGTISLFMAKIISKVGTMRPLLLGSFFGVIGLWSLSTLNGQSSIEHVVIGLCLVGINLGIIMPTTVTLALSKIPQNKISVASGLFYTLVFLFFSVAVAVSGGMIHTLGAHFFNQLLLESSIHMTKEGQNSFSGIFSGVQSVLKISAPDIQIQMAKDAFSKATHFVFKFTAILQLLSFLICFFMKEEKKLS